MIGTMKFPFFFLFDFGYAFRINRATITIIVIIYWAAIPPSFSFCCRHEQAEFALVLSSNVGNWQWWQKVGGLNLVVGKHDDLVYVCYEKAWDNQSHKKIRSFDAFPFFFIHYFECDAIMGRASSSRFHAMWIYWSTYSTIRIRERKASFFLSFFSPFPFFFFLLDGFCFHKEKR